ncbi:MAG: hypothetical protein Q8O37_00690 [Sulfuricellaceae bacterium]|nr:hypothetical protein [Sulfuricellaceae bacterium]
MNTMLENRIVERLHQMDDAHLSEILDFVEFVADRKRRSKLQEDDDYLLGVEASLSEWAGQADEEAYRDLNKAR